MPTLPPDHQPIRHPYKDRDKLLAFLLDSDARNQRMAEVLDLFAAELRTQAVRMGNMVDPPLPIRPQMDDAPALQRESA